jgi:hypothetical protein
MNCQQARPWLQAFGDGELEGQTRRQVGDHLRHCPACRSEYEARRRLVTEVQTALAEEARAPDYLAAAVSRQIAREPSPRRGFLPGVRRVVAMRSFRIACSAAGVMAALLVGVWIFAGQDLAFAKAIDSALRGIKSAHFTAVEGGRTVEVWATPTAERVSSEEGWMVAKEGKAYLFDTRAKRVRVTKGGAAHLDVLRGLNVLLLSERLRGRALGEPTVRKETVTLPDGRQAIRISGTAKAKRLGVVLDYEGTMLVDPATNLIMSGEARQLVPDTPEAQRLKREGKLWPVHVKVDTVEYNRGVPAGMFDTATPAGWRVRGK